MKVVHVIWKDSTASNEWTEIDEVGHELDTTNSVGFLISDDGDFFLLALSYDRETDSINCYKKIPKVAVVAIKTIAYVSI